MGRMASTINFLRVLSDPTRLRLMLLLVEEELTVAELQEILGMAQSRISASLGQLKREGLAADRRVGKNIFYSAKGASGGMVGEILKQARTDLSEAAGDLAALAMTMRKRKDRAAEYFNKLAGRFGRVYVPGRSWQALSHALLGLLPPMVIADMGAGEGTLAQLLARTAKKVIAIDNSRKMVEFGSALAREHGFKNIEYRHGDVEAPPVEPESVDLVVFSQVLHHVPNPPRALEAANKALKTGGRVVILDLASHKFEQARELYAHAWLGFVEIELHQMLRKAGFSKIRTSMVSRESEAPHFQTLLATATK
jgi:ubiquinone/menaquinone biosynthesis C-methylase UbiE/DNA-binding transcriptional ArsR family regulator